MELCIVLLFMVGLGWVTGSIAASKGRDRGVWMFLGAFFGVFALWSACTMSDQRSAAALVDADRDAAARVDRLAHLGAAKPKPQVELQREVTGSIGA
jgi:hypothetical protein